MPNVAAIDNNTTDTDTPSQLNDFKKTEINGVFYSKLYGLIDETDELHVRQHEVIYVTVQLFVNDTPYELRNAHFYIYDSNGKIAYNKTYYTYSGESQHFKHRIPTNLNKGNYTIILNYNGNIKDKLLPSSKTIQLYVH